jgi:predicted secreted hydrolase
MATRLTTIFVLVLLILTVTMYRLVWQTDARVNDAAYRITDILADPDTAGYARAIGQRAFVFPQDHGPHAEFKTEWWYYTGNLETERARKFGFQLTFFRTTLSPADSQSRARSGWQTNQVYGTGRRRDIAIQSLAGELVR